MKTTDYTGDTDADLTRKHYMLKARLRVVAREHRVAVDRCKRLSRVLAHTQAALLAVDLERGSRL